MFGMKLTINKYSAVLLRLLNQMSQCHLGSVRPPVEHGFGRETSIQTYTIQTTDEFPAIPNLNGLSVPQLK